MKRVAVVALLGGCSVYEDHVRIEPLFASEDAKLDCDKLCGGPDIHSVNYCTVATSTPRPYLVCELDVLLLSGPQKFQVGVEPPRGFDPPQEGDVALENCQLSACAMPIRARFGHDATSFEVKGCRAAPQLALKPKKYLVCSFRTKTGFTAQ